MPMLEKLPGIYTPGEENTRRTIDQTEMNQSWTPCSEHSQQRRRKMAANKNALTQPKFELGITSIIQYVLQGD